MDSRKRSRGPDDHRLGVNGPGGYNDVHDAAKEEVQKYYQLNHEGIDTMLEWCSQNNFKEGADLTIDEWRTLLEGFINKFEDVAKEGYAKDAKAQEQKMNLPQLKQLRFFVCGEGSVLARAIEILATIKRGVKEGIAIEAKNFTNQMPSVTKADKSTEKRGMIVTDQQIFRALQLVTSDEYQRYNSPQAKEQRRELFAPRALYQHYADDVGLFANAVTIIQLQDFENLSRLEQEMLIPPTWTAVRHALSSWLCPIAGPMSARSKVGKGQNYKGLVVQIVSRVGNYESKKLNAALGALNGSA